MARAVGTRRTTPSSNTQQPGVAPGGTMGGRPTRKVGRRPGSRPIAVGDEVYLWVLVIIEALLMGALRQRFRKHHGG